MNFRLSVSPRFRRLENGFVLRSLRHRRRPNLCQRASSYSDALRSSAKLYCREGGCPNSRTFCRAFCGMVYWRNDRLVLVFWFFFISDFFFGGGLRPEGLRISGISRPVMSRSYSVFVYTGHPTSRSSSEYPRVFFLWRLWPELAPKRARHSTIRFDTYFFLFFFALMNDPLQSCSLRDFPADSPLNLSPVPTSPYELPLARTSFLRCIPPMVPGYTLDPRGCIFD